MKVLLGRDAPPTRRLTFRWLWEPRDVWLGIFWNRAKLGDLGDEFLLTFATWATRSASRLDSHQEFGVWERRNRG